VRPGWWLCFRFPVENFLGQYGPFCRCFSALDAAPNIAPRAGTAGANAMADVFRYIVVDSLDASAPKIRFVPEAGSAGVFKKALPPLTVGISKSQLQKVWHTNTVVSNVYFDMETETQGWLAVSHTRTAGHYIGSIPALKGTLRRLGPPTHPGGWFPVRAVIQAVSVNTQHLNSVERADADVLPLRFLTGRQLDWAPTAPIPECLLPTGCR
jgi:hypothetical protein